MMASTRAQILCGWARVLVYNAALDVSAMVSVVGQKRGSEFFQPMGRVSGMDTRCSPPWVLGQMNPIFWASDNLRPI